MYFDFPTFAKPQNVVCNSQNLYKIIDINKQVNRKLIKSRYKIKKMTETQFNSIETYLEHFKDEISRINIDNINETTNAIWDKLDSQNKILEEIVGLIKDLIEK